MSPRVAFLQSTVGFDGRSRTLAVAGSILNELGIVPTLLTFSDERYVAKLRANAPLPLELEHVQLDRPVAARGHQFEQLVLPRAAAAELRAYDLVYASDTSVYWENPGQRTVRLVCFPIEAVPTYEVRYRRLPYRLYAAAGTAYRRLAFRGFPRNATWIANSRFTKAEMLRRYPLSHRDVHVVYPPVDLRRQSHEDGRARRGVVTVGGFHEDKAQLEQIEIARALGEVPFVLVGSTRSRRYFRRCVEAARDAPNVELVPDAAPAEVERRLAEAKVFLHTKRFEHFGMTTVEGVDRGCLPIVHDSGGQREVVPVAELRFGRAAEAVPLIRRALAGELDAHLGTLRRHIQRFGIEQFRDRMAPLLVGAVDAAA
jgi:glycosyltransferase involved in cell wall biosynthesis